MAINKNSMFLRLFSVHHLVFFWCTVIFIKCCVYFYFYFFLSTGDLLECWPSKSVTIKDEFLADDFDSKEVRCILIFFSSKFWFKIHMPFFGTHLILYYFILAFWMSKFCIRRKLQIIRKLENNREQVSFQKLAVL